MKRITFFAGLLTSLFMVAGNGFAADPGSSSQSPKQVVFSRTTTAEATIQDIDYKNRTVTLKGEDGNIVHVDVGPDAPNFNQLKKGDRVKAQYYESTALSLRKPGEEAASGESQQLVTVPGQGGNGPSRLMVNTRQITARVQQVDAKTRTVTLKGPEGNTVKLKVDENTKGFDQIKPGDQVVATFTDAVALSVTAK